VAIGEANDEGAQTKPIQVLQNWPSSHTKIGTKEKVPSEIAYTKDGIEWGSSIPPHEARNMWMKLSLDRRQPGVAAKIVQELASDSAGPTRRPVDIIADYLKCVKEHVIKTFVDQYGPGLWQSLPIILVITVPAVWSDLAKHRTMQAFDKAGFNITGFPRLAHTITTTEPEAAATFTIKTLKGGAHDEQLDIGDGFVICDMGGGTVDLISYRVAGLQPIVVEETTVGNGDQCGSTFVDQAFIQYLEDKLGVDDFVKIAGCRAKDVLHTQLSQKLGRIVGDFIMEAKTGFSGKQHSFLRLPHPLASLPDDEERGIQDGEIKLTPCVSKATSYIFLHIDMYRDAMKKMFGPSIGRTRELIAEQLEQAMHHGEVEIKVVDLLESESILHANLVSISS
jgi:hypothetical protein